MEFDNLTYEEQLTIVEKLKLPKPTLAIYTGGKSIHYYWILKTPTEAKKWRALQNKLIKYLSTSDNSLKKICQLMRLPQCSYFNSKTKEYSGKETKILEEHCDRTLKYNPEDLEKVIDENTPKNSSVIRTSVNYTSTNPNQVPNLVVLLSKLGLNLPTDDYLATALENEFLKVANLTDDRNNYLNTACFNLGQLVNQGLDKDLIETVMIQASHINGKVEDSGIDNITNTIKSGIESGIKKPRSDRPSSENNLAKLAKEYKEYTLSNNLLLEITTRLEKTLYYSSISGCWYYYTEKNHYFAVIPEAMVLTLIDNIYTQKSQEWCNLKNYNPSNHQITATKLKDLIYLTKAKLTLNIDQENDREKQRLALCKNFLPLKNGIVNLETKELLPHNPKYLNTYVLDYNYDPTAEAEKTLNFLNTAVSRKGDFKILIACVRAMLLSRYDLQFFFEVIGRKGSGKGTFVRLVQDLIGDINCYTTTLQDLEEDSYSFADFHNKKLVIISEGTQYHKRANKFLSITGADNLNVRQKHKQSGGSKKFEGCVLVNGNERIRASDRANALERRRRHIDFDKRPNKPNTRLNEELREEISGFLNYILLMDNEEMENIIKEPHLYSEGYTERMIEDKLNEDPLTNYVNENIIIDPDNGISTDELWQHYCRYLREKEQCTSKTKDPNKLGSALREILKDHKIEFKDSNNINHNGRRKRGLKGISLREPFDNETPNLFDNLN